MPWEALEIEMGLRRGHFERIEGEGKSPTRGAGVTEESNVLPLVGHTQTPQATHLHGDAVIAGVRVGDKSAWERNGVEWLSLGMIVFVLVALVTVAYATNRYLDERRAYIKERAATQRTYQSWRTTRDEYVRVFGREQYESEFGSLEESGMRKEWDLG